LFKPEVLDRRIKMRRADMGAHPIKRDELFFQFGDNLR